METNYIHEDVPGGVPIKMWTRGVPVEDEAKRQLTNAARLPIVFKHIAAMPDVHFGIGATVGSVIPTLKAIIPAAVGVDIGCGMMACKTTLTAEDLPDNLAPLRSAIERAVPHGRAPGARDPGAWSKVPGSVDTAWAQLEPDFTELCRDYPKLEKTNNRIHLGTLGTGNHFIEVCLDEEGCVWFMLHSGSRGVGNAIGTMFIELAKQDALRHNANLPDRDLAYFEEGSALLRRLRARRGLGAAVRGAEPRGDDAPRDRGREDGDPQDLPEPRRGGELPPQLRAEGASLRRGRVRHPQGRGEREGRAAGHHPRQHGRAQLHRARQGQPGQSFESCSHGAGRAMSRGEAKRRFTLADHRAATEGVECRKDKDVIDETPAAYKDIDAVMAAQRDLVDVVHTLKQVVCVKG